MRLSTKVRYAAARDDAVGAARSRGAATVARDCRGRRDSPRSISSSSTIPLRHAGLLRTERGPERRLRAGAGRPPPSPRWTWSRPMEGPLDLLDCIGNDTACDRTEACARAKLWVQVQEAIDAVLSQDHARGTAGESAVVRDPISTAVLPDLTRARARTMLELPMQQVYFDHAATTPPRAEVIAAMAESLRLALGQSLQHSSDRDRGAGVDRTGPRPRRRLDRRHARKRSCSPAAARRPITTP